MLIKKFETLEEIEKLLTGIIDQQQRRGTIFDDADLEFTRRYLTDPFVHALVEMNLKLCRNILDVVRSNLTKQHCRNDILTNARDYLDGKIKDDAENGPSIEKLTPTERTYQQINRNMLVEIQRALEI
jgi:hypothetical protein